MRAWSRSRPWSSSHELAPSATRARPVSAQFCAPFSSRILSVRAYRPPNFSRIVITLSRGTGRDEAHESRSGREDAELNGC